MASESQSLLDAFFAKVSGSWSPTATEQIVTIQVGEDVAKIGMRFTGGSMLMKKCTVTGVDEGSVAETSGVEPGDVCYSVNKQKVASMTKEVFFNLMRARPLEMVLIKGTSMDHAQDESSESSGSETSSATHSQRKNQEPQKPPSAPSSASRYRRQLMAMLESVTPVHPQELSELIQRARQAGVSQDILRKAESRLTELNGKLTVKQYAIDAIGALEGLSKMLEGTDVEALSKAIKTARRDVDEALLRARDHLAVLREHQAPNKRNLLEEYSIGDKLGEGSFGVVYTCLSRKTGKELAAKMVDKVETPMLEILDEVNILQQISHRNVVRLVDVIFERCFVCLVMDRYEGGNLVLRMLHYWNAYGKIPMWSCIVLCRQMCEAVSYLHGERIAHRDVKADNYLTTSKELSDPAIHVVLSDFGCAAVVEEWERLSDLCGTKTYWAPEVFDADYGLKADIWALGVVIYGMIHQCFPFLGEHDVKQKLLVFPPGMPPSAEQFLERLLFREEEKRLTAAQMVDHKFLRQTKAELELAMTSLEDSLDGFFNDVSNHVEDFFHIQIDENVAERRDELVGRLFQIYGWMTDDSAEDRPPSETTITSTHQSIRRKSKLLQDELQLSLTLRDRVAQMSSMGSMRDNKIGHSYRWQKPSWLDEWEASLEGATEVKETQQVSTAMVESSLKHHRIDLSAFGKDRAKTLDHFATEVARGAARLMLDATQHKKLVRVVDLVLVRLLVASHSGGPRRFLVEVSEKLYDGREHDTGRLPGRKKEPHETRFDVTTDVVERMLNMGDCDIRFSAKTEAFEDAFESPSFPGVTTVYRKEIVEGEVIATDEEILKRICLLGDQKEYTVKDEAVGGSTKFFRWLDREFCQQENIELEVPKDAEIISGLIEPPIGMNVEELSMFLISRKVDISKYGKNGAKTLKEFSQELIKGEASLVEGADGRLCRVIDMVVLKITNSETGEVLVETCKDLAHTDGDTEDAGSLPTRPRRPDENHFVSVMRVLKVDLGLEETYIHIEKHGVKILEEEKALDSYPDIATVYRKRIVAAQMIKAQLMLASTRISLRSETQ